MVTRAIPRLAAAWVVFGLGTAAAFGVDLRITAPAAPGSGWDQLAKMLAERLAGLPDPVDVRVVNVPGGSGTVGLGQFSTSAGENDLLVVGLTMMDAALVNRSPVTLDQLTPIARLSVEPFVLAVPAASPLRSPADLRAAFAAEPGRVSLAGGPVGGVDHAAAIRLVRAVGLTPKDLGYVPFLSSQEAASALAEEQVTAALLAVGEVQAEVAAGRLRILGVAARERIPQAPGLVTLVEAGLPIEFANWRGLVARAGLSRADRDRLSALVAQASGSPLWGDALARRKWQSAYLPADGFAAFLRDEQARLKDTLKSAGLLKRSDE